MRVALALGDRIGDRHCREEGLAVRVAWRVEDGLGGSPLDDPAQVHDRDRVAHVGHDRQVVGDHEVRHSELALQFGEQVQDLRLRRHVERGDRFVEHEELGPDAEGPGDRRALQLAARDVARVALGEGRREPDEVEQLRDLGLLFLHRQLEVGGQRLAHAGADARGGVERGVGVLEDGLHLPSHRSQLAARDLGDVDAVEPHLARGGLDDAQDEAGERRLARPRLAHQSHRLAGFDLDVDAVDGPHVADRPPQEVALDREQLREALGADEEARVVHLGAHARRLGSRGHRHSAPASWMSPVRRHRLSDVGPLVGSSGTRSPRHSSST